MKISVERLKQIIKEEVDAYALQEKLTDKEKKKKAKLEDDLDDLEHKWMKEGKLSSALMERYQLKESVGKVLWHSLDKDGQIGEYDMRFGDVVVKGILPEHIEPVLEVTHVHSTQTKRKKKKK